MAQINILAKFFSQALEWKVRFPAAKFYGGLKYEPFIYDWSRRIFPDYSRLYPDDKEFTQKFVQDLRNKNKQLLKILNPEVITSEHQEINRQFQTEAQIENQQVQATSSTTDIGPTPASYAPLHLASFTPPVLATPLPQVTPGEAVSTMESAKEEAKATPRQPSTQTTFRIPKIPATLLNGVKNLASQAGIFFKKNFGRILTVGNFGTLASGIVGTFTGLGLTNGSVLGGLVGGAGGVATRFWVGGGNAGQFLGKIGFSLADSWGSFSTAVAGPRWSILRRGGFFTGGRVALLGLGLFIFFVLGAGLLSAILPPAEPLEAAPVSPVYTGGGAGKISCPLNGPVSITNGSKDAGGHCTLAYEKSYGVCTKSGSTGYTGRDTAIDVISPDQFVYLPNIQGAGQIKWIVDEAGNIPIAEGEGGGISVAAYTTVNNKTYRIRFVHIQSTNLKIGDSVDAGTAAGQYYLNNPYGAHVHITTQEDGVFKPADLYFNLCQ